MRAVELVIWGDSIVFLETLAARRLGLGSYCCHSLEFRQTQLSSRGHHSFYRARQSSVRHRNFLPLHYHSDLYCLLAMGLSQAVPVGLGLWAVSNELAILALDTIFAIFLNRHSQSTELNVAAIVASGLSGVSVGFWQASPLCSLSCLLLHRRLSWWK